MFCHETLRNACSASSYSTAKGNTSTSSDSKGKTKEKDNKNKSSDKSKSSSGAKPASSETPTHLGKDGKLTEEECQRHIKDKLCMFCRQPGHMARDCPKSTSKSSKAKACTAKAMTPTAAESKN